MDIHKLVRAFHVGNGWELGNGMIEENDYEMDRSPIPYVKRTRKYILDHVFLSWASSLNDSRSATGRAQPEVFVLVEVPQNQLLGHPHIMKFLISISFLHMFISYVYSWSYMLIEKTIANPKKYAGHGVSAPVRQPHLPAFLRNAPPGWRPNWRLSLNSKKFEAMKHQWLIQFIVELCIWFQ